MGERLSSWLQQIKHHRYIAIGIIVALLLLIALIAITFVVYMFGWDWTGFRGGESKVTTIMITPGTIATTPGTIVATEQQPAKTLWDWLGLLGVLAIPVVVGVGAAWFTTQQAKLSDRVNIDIQRETALQKYIDKMSELLLQEHLSELKPEYEKARTIARARTLTVLRALDPKRKGSVIQFLSESKLISIIDLSGANLSEARLGLTHMEDANLILANLESAHLTHTHLEHANLKYANLSGADLSKSNLSGADLSGADLSGANLKDAKNITTEELEMQAKTLKGATMPNGRLHS